MRELHNEILNVEQRNNKRRISFAIVRGNQTIAADTTGDSIAEHSDDESLSNPPDTPDIQSEVSFHMFAIISRPYIFQSAGYLFILDQAICLE